MTHILKRREKAKAEKLSQAYDRGYRIGYAAGRDEQRSIQTQEVQRLVKRCAEFEILLADRDLLVAEARKGILNRAFPGVSGKALLLACHGKHAEAVRLLAPPANLPPLVEEHQLLAVNDH